MEISLSLGTLWLIPGFCFPVYLFILREREREREGGSGGGEGERGRLGNRFHTVSTESSEGLQLTNCEIMTRAEVKSWMFNQLSHPGVPIPMFN